MKRNKRVNRLTPKRNQGLKPVHRCSSNFTVLTGPSCQENQPKHPYQEFEMIITDTQEHIPEISKQVSPNPEILSFQNQNIPAQSDNFSLLVRAFPPSGLTGSRPVPDQYHLNSLQISPEYQPNQTERNSAYPRHDYHTFQNHVQIDNVSGGAK